MLDFGREVNGRLEFVSDSDQAADVDLRYGRVRVRGPERALSRHQLRCTLPPHATAYGPKSAFRYALLRFVHGANVAFVPFSSTASITR